MLAMKRAKRRSLVASLASILAAIHIPLDLVGLALFLIPLLIFLSLYVDFYIVVTDSMVPAIHPGSLVVTVRVSPFDVKIGDVLAVRQGDIVVVHRVVGIDMLQGVFVLKGDNAPGTQIVRPQDVLGRVAIVIPYVGIIIGNRTLFLFLLGLALILLVLKPKRLLAMVGLR